MAKKTNKRAHSHPFRRGSDPCDIGKTDSPSIYSPIPGGGTVAAWFDGRKLKILLHDVPGVVDDVHIAYTPHTIRLNDLEAWLEFIRASTHLTVTRLRVFEGMALWQQFFDPTEAKRRMDEAIAAGFEVETAMVKVSTRTIATLVEQLLAQKK